MAQSAISWLALVLILRELIYAERAVPHIFSGQATAREPQAHLISAGVLSALLTGKVHNIDFDLHVEEENFVQNSMKL